MPIAPLCGQSTRDYRPQALLGKAGAQLQALPALLVHYLSLAVVCIHRRDRELAKFEAYLNKEGCQNINALAKNMPTRLAYPIKNEYEGIYVLYTYAAKRQTAKAVQLLLSNPEAGSEDKLLRHITLCKM